MYGIICVHNKHIELCKKDSSGTLRVFANKISTRKVVTILNQNSDKFGWNYKYYPIPLPNIREYL